MTKEEAKKMLKAKLECLNRETSGTNHDCNMRLCDGCALNYEQGNMGEQKESLVIAIKALEQESQIEDINIRRMLIEANVNGYAEGRKDVLDKVRAEIEEQKKCRCFDDSDMFVYRTGLNDAINIIKKYRVQEPKTESEIEEMNLDDSIKNVKSECYVSPSLNMDRAIMVNTSLDMLISKIEKTKELLTRYDTRSATKCYEIVQMLKEEYEV